LAIKLVGVEALVGELATERLIARMADGGGAESGDRSLYAVTERIERPDPLPIGLFPPAFEDLLAGRSFQT
jgi:hypothetical protein